jgi:hypothetical protein
MTHLTESEIVDLLDGQLAPERLRHAERCPKCRTQADALGAISRAARGADVPEPSPLFWEHLSARITTAIGAEPAPSRWRTILGLDTWRAGFAAMALVLVAGLTWQMLLKVEDPSRPGSVTPPAATEAATHADIDGFIDAWDAIEAAATDLDWEDAQSIGIASRPGSAERMVSDLTAEERTELVRLIEEEMKRTGA